MERLNRLQRLLKPCQPQIMKELLHVGPGILFPGFITFQADFAGPDLVVKFPEIRFGNIQINGFFGRDDQHEKDEVKHMAHLTHQEKSGIMVFIKAFTKISSEIIAFFLFAGH